jgi:hypothetical protein
MLENTQTGVEGEHRWKINSTGSPIFFTTFFSLYPDPYRQTKIRPVLGSTHFFLHYFSKKYRSTRLFPHIFFPVEIQSVFLKKIWIFFTGTGSESEMKCFFSYTRLVSDEMPARPPKRLEQDRGMDHGQTRLETDRDT